MTTVQERTIGEWLAQNLTRAPGELPTLAGIPCLTKVFRTELSNTDIERCILATMNKLDWNVYRPTRNFSSQETQIVFAPTIVMPPGRLVVINSVEAGMVTISLFYEYPRAAMFLLNYGVVRQWNSLPSS